MMIAAPCSGAGKTTVTCGLLGTLKNTGKHPCSFKCGPDYIDPMYHRRVLGIPSGNLDTFFTDQQTTVGDVAVLEGVMGLYDGVGGIGERGSCYDLAHTLHCPILLVVDAHGAARSVLAQIKGFLDYDRYGCIKAVILNKIKPEFGRVLGELVEKELKIPCLGTLPRTDLLSLPERHLGLFLPEEIRDMQTRQEKLAQLFAEHISVSACLQIAESAKALEVGEEDACVMSPSGKGLRLAVARDEAFCFYYRENLSLLKKAGLDLVEFSPLRDDKLPAQIHGLLLGGGYPEQHLEDLSQNRAMREDIRKAIEDGMPVLAECGGFLYLLDAIEDQKGQAFPMVGAISGRAFWNKKLTRFGYVTILGKDGTKIRGHEFHYYDTDHNGEDFMAEKPVGEKRWKCMFTINGGAVGFPHLYYPSNPAFVTKFAEAMQDYEKQRTFHR